MVTTSSLRRGGSTAEASAGVAADLRSASDVGGLRAHHYTCRHVHDIGIVRLLSVSHRKCDASFDSSGRGPIPGILGVIRLILIRSVPRFFSWFCVNFTGSCGS
jgi:hypothetical protein